MSGSVTPTGITLHPKYVPPVYRLKCPVCEMSGYPTANILRNHIKSLHPGFDINDLGVVVTQLSSDKRAELLAAGIPPDVIAHYVR